MSGPEAGPLVGLYIRLSKEDESEGPSQSVQNQEALLREYVRRQGWAVRQVYVDDGWSGTNFQRPAFRRMLADIEAGRIDLVLTKDLSRLGRDYILTGHYLERYFPEHRVRYISLLDGIDTGVENAANEITPFRALLNDLYAKDISKKIKSVKRDKQRRGQFIGGKPVYGYKMHPTEKNRIVPDEGAAPTVRRIFALALAGQSCRQIAQLLNGEGVPSPAVYAGLPAARSGRCACRWSSERISEMLRNETYLGRMVQGRSVKVSYKSKKCLRQPPERWVVVPGTHPPLVDAEVFERVGQLLVGRRHTRSRTHDFLLKGLIFCHRCGRPLGVLCRKNAAGGEVLYLVCRACQAQGQGGLCFREDAVTRAVQDQILRLCRQLVRPEELAEQARLALRQARLPAAKEELPDLAREIERLNGQLDQIYADRLSGLLAPEDSERLYQETRRRRDALARQAEALRRQGATRTEAEADRLAGRFWDELAQNRELLSALLERVELDRQGELTLFFRAGPPACPEPKEEV